MNHYYIINLPATRQQSQIIYWTAGHHADTPDYRQAMIVNEQQVNANLERYDNGATTQAVLCDVVHSHTGPWEQLLHGHNPISHTGDAA